MRTYPSLIRMSEQDPNDGDKNTSKYDELIRQIKEGHNIIAKESIPKACYALKEENSNLSNEDIRDRIKQDLIEIWSRTTIYEHMPEEFKDQEKAEEIKEGIKQKKHTDKSSSRVDPPMRIPITTAGELISSEEPHARLEELELEKGKLQEQLKEQTEQYHSVLKAINDNKNKTVTESKEYKALLSELEMLKQERDELKQIASRQMKDNPSDTFQNAASIKPESIEVEFPARDISTFFLDQRIVKDIMYLKIEGNKVVGWESDTIRAKNKSRAKG